MTTSARPTRRATSRLLDWLVADFRAHRHDVKHLIRTILNSAAYARSSVPVPGNEADGKFLSHYPVKRLPAEVLLDAIARVTEVPTPFVGYPAGWRSMQLPDSKVQSTFLDAFGRPERLNTCSCERSADPSMAQALHLANGTTINDKLRSEAGVVARSIADNRPDDAILDRLFLAALCRRPTEAEAPGACSRSWPTRRPTSPTPRPWPPPGGRRSRISTGRR